MYRDPPEIAAATRALWAALGDRLRDAGLVEAPARLDETIAHDAAWLDPRLLLAQTCGYPFVTRLRGRVRLVATPVYAHAGCDGVLVGSFVVVHERSSARGIVDLRGATVAVNDPHSNSGMNLLRRLVAPHAVAGRFFGRVIASGSHVASLALVAGGQAATAAIDCVTYGNLARFAPEQLAGIRILATTAKTPGLPLITRAAAGEREVTMLRDGLTDMLADPSTARLRDTLGLRGIEILSDDAYEIVLEIERDAAALGFPVIA